MARDLIDDVVYVMEYSILLRNILLGALQVVTICKVVLEGPLFNG